MERVGGFFVSISRNKESLTINLKHPEDVVIVKKFVKKPHVVVENFRPSAIGTVGVDYET